MENPSSSMLSQRVNFEFGFNDANFSDRVLHIEISDNSSDSKSGSEGSHKRKREDSESCAVVKVVKTLHISSVLLAANSPFFHKLFKNGMTESKQRETTLRISASEEAGAMEVLNFMYSNTLKATSTPDLLGVLVVAVKFEAIDCVRYCCESLQEMPMSLESAVMYMELPASVLVSELVQPLIDAAKKCLCAHFKDLKKSQEEAMTLPLSAVEVLLDSADLEISEDDTFDFLLKWARAQYPELNKRREILTKKMVRFLRYQYMSGRKLREVLVCPDLDREEISKLMIKSFIMLVEDPYGKYGEFIHESVTYPVIYIKVEQCGTPQPRCVVYFDLKKEDCENLFPSGHLSSHSFRLGGGSFYLKALGCHLKTQGHSFGMYLHMIEGSQSCTVDFEFGALKKSSMKFQQMRKTKVTYSDTLLNWGFPNLFNIPWIDFIGKESDYFIDGILHLRADLTIKDSQA